MPVPLARAVTGPLSSRPRSLRFKLALGWFFLIKGILEIVAVITCLELGWSGWSTLALMAVLTYAVITTLVSALALWRLELHRQDQIPELFRTGWD